ncbi:MAG: hypothetical protein JXX28_06235 [Deltaproteobacteria bacterium]|nr:hypothetical protein [Deltaproteobacteria bacterium]
MLFPEFEPTLNSRPDLATPYAKFEKALGKMGKNPILVPNRVAKVSGITRPLASFFISALASLNALQPLEVKRCSVCEALAYPAEIECSQCGANFTESPTTTRKAHTFAGVKSMNNEAWEEASEKARIGIVTALPREANAVLCSFEEKSKIARSSNVYDVGTVPGVGGTHYCIHATSGMGNQRAGVVGTQMLERFPNIDFLIMVGIAGIIPAPTDPKNHARLGDIVVSNLKGVVQYDFKKEHDGWEEIRAAPVRPANTLLSGVERLQRLEEDGTAADQTPWVVHGCRIAKRLKLEWPETDVLHSANDPDVEITHPEDPDRTEGVPRVFRAPIASSNTLLKNPKRRDQLGKDHACRAVEMEGSGVAEAAWAGESGYLVIRAGCDYCDKHKDKDWQKYAAALAAGYLRALLEELAV